MTATMHTPLPLFSRHIKSNYDGNNAEGGIHNSRHAVIDKKSISPKGINTKKGDATHAKEPQKPKATASTDIPC